MVSMAVLIRRITKGAHIEHKKYVTKTWSAVILNKKKYIYSYLKCSAYDKLLKPRQSFRITLYYQPSCYNPCHIAIVFIFSTTKIPQQSWKQLKIALRRIKVIQSQCVFSLLTELCAIYYCFLIDSGTFLFSFFGVCLLVLLRTQCF